MVLNTTAWCPFRSPLLTWISQDIKGLPPFSKPFKIPHCTVMGVILHHFASTCTCVRQNLSGPSLPSAAHLSQRLHQSVWSEGNVSQKRPLFNRFHHHHQMKNHGKWTQRVSCTGPLRWTEIWIHTDFLGYCMSSLCWRSEDAGSSNPVNNLTLTNFIFSLINAGSNLSKQTWLSGRQLGRDERSSQLHLPCRPIYILDEK